MSSPRTKFLAELQTGRREGSLLQRSAVESWLARGLAAAYVPAPGDPVPRYLLELLPED